MKWYTMKSMCKHYKLAYSTIRSYGKDSNIVKLLMLSYFIETLKINEKDLQVLQHFFKRRTKPFDEIYLDRSLKKWQKKNWDLEIKSLELAKQFFYLKLTKEELKAIEILKNNSKD